MWICSNCKSEYPYPFDSCLSCSTALTVIPHLPMRVIGYTEVHIPSKDHPTVPYQVLLLEDSAGNRALLKSTTSHAIGETITPGKISTTQNIKNISVIGSGTMGIGIATLCLSAGISTTIKTRTLETSRIREEILRLSHKAGQTNDKLLESLLKITNNFSDLSNSELIIECLPETLSLKQNLFKELEQHCNTSCIFATNTSSLPLYEISKSLKHPERVVGMHFFNPVHRMALVEIITGEKSDKQIVAKVYDLAKTLTKTPIYVKDAPGFIVNRLLLPFLYDAVTLLESEVSTAKDIDAAIRLGLNHPLGPFELIDLIGVDVYAEILAELDRKGGGAYPQHKTITQMIRDKHLGRKSEKGFYTY